MRTRLLSLLAGIVAVLALAPAASASSVLTADRPEPLWLTPGLKAQLSVAGADGVQVSEEYLNTECPGYQEPGVSAAGCIVSPAGCTANFIFTDSSSKYVGTAAHCTDKVGDTVIMQVDSTTLAEVGTVAKRTGQEEPGQDFALIRIFDEVASKWGVNPRVPVWGGPNGIYTGCDPKMVGHYGHGYGVAVAQGKPEGGLATNWHDDGYGWAGAGAPGDSGSPVVLAGSGEAAGNLTHLIIYDPDYVGSTLAGTRITEILRFAGVDLVNADGSTTSYSPSDCGGTTADGGGGDGGGNGGGKGGGSDKPKNNNGGGKGGGKKA